MAFKNKVDIIPDSLPYRSKVLNLLLNRQFIIVEILGIITMKSPETNCRDTFRHSLFCLGCRCRRSISCNRTLDSYFSAVKSAKKRLDRHPASFSM